MLSSSLDTYKIIERVNNKLKLKNENTNEEIKTLYKPYELMKVDEIEVMKDNKAEVNEKINEKKQEEKRIERKLKREGIDESNIIRRSKRLMNKK